MYEVGSLPGMGSGRRCEQGEYDKSTWHGSEGVASLSVYAVELVCHERPARLESLNALIDRMGVVARLESVAPLSDCVVERACSRARKAREASTT